MKINDAFDRYLKIKSGWVLPITIQSNTYVYNRHIRDAFAEHELSDLSIEFIAEKFDHWRSSMSSHALLSIKKLLVAFFNFLIEEGEIERNPLRKIKIRVDDPIVAIRTAEEIDIILRHAENNDLIYTIIVVLASTGLRISEMKGLQWEDIDFKNKTMSINRTYYAAAIHATKTKRSKRTIYVSDIVLTALKKHRKAVIEKVGASCEWVFPSRTKRPMSTSWIGRILKAFYIECGLPHTTLHSYRHYHATMLLAAGVPLKQVESRLGHSNPMILLRRYAHVTSEGEDILRSVLDNQ